MPAILSNARRVVKQWNQIDLDGLNVENLEQLSIAFLTETAMRGSDMALKIFNKAAEHIAYAISLYATLFDIHLVILGGELLKSSSHFFEG